MLHDNVSFSLLYVGGENWHGGAGKTRHMAWEWFGFSRSVRGRLPLCIIQMESLIILIPSPFRSDLCIVFFKGGDVIEVRRCEEIQYCKFPDLD
jgi:hypothetical protein